MNHLLPDMLMIAVPLWVDRYLPLSFDERQKLINEINQSDFCYRMEHLLHKTEGKTAQAFNDLARSLALLSFVPGGITFMGTKWETKEPSHVEATVDGFENR